MRLTIEGLQEAQAANLASINALKPEGEFGRAVKFVTSGLHRLSVIYTHVDTGALRSSHRMEVTGLEGQVFLAKNARNPRSNRLVREYGAFEHARGGDHAFYDRAIASGSARLGRATGLVVSRIKP